MAQDPSTLHSFINDAVSLFTEKLSGLMDNHPKRYAIYFPSKASIEAEQHDASDDGSSWEFRASIVPSSVSFSSTSCSTSGSTPAQEIVIRYRSGAFFGLSDTRSSSPSQYSEPDSWEMTSSPEPYNLEHGQVAPNEDMRARYRQSRYDALLDMHQEAVHVAQSAGLSHSDRIVCNRPGCRDTLANVKALMYHLHIHDIHDRQVLCPRCKGSYDSQRELRMHNCHRRSNPSPTSSFRRTFRRVFTKLSF